MTRAAWIEAVSGFGLDHLPYCSFDPGDGVARLGVGFGEFVLDLSSAARAGLVPRRCDAANLDLLLRGDVTDWADVREAITGLFADHRHEPAVGSMLHRLDDVVLRLPFRVGDFVDFYSSEAHATNVGRLFRPDAAPLLPNWRHLPVGYHGRAGTVVVTGTDLVRPVGQVRTADGLVSVRPTTKLDFEVEMGWVVGGVAEPGTSPGIDDAATRIFGFTPLNDWSARDIQAWEYVPLGPFLGKSFATSISGWVTPLAALEPYRVPQPEQRPAPLDYLRTDRDWGIDVVLTARMTSQVMRADHLPPVELCRVSYAGMYWTVAQQFAHLTVNGAAANPGDLAGSGTISGWRVGELGSLLEITRDGAAPLELPDGSWRSFLEDGDEVEITAATPDGRIELGSVKGRVAAAPASHRAASGN